jgi:tRNA-dihydrouridine synthase B
MLELYGREAGLRHARKHLGWYLDRFAPDLPTEEKAAIMISRDPADVARRMTVALTGNTAVGRKEAA